MNTKFTKPLSAFSAAYNKQNMPAKINESKAGAVNVAVVGAKDSLAFKQWVATEGNKILSVGVKTDGKQLSDRDVSSAIADQKGYSAPYLAVVTVADPEGAFANLQKIMKGGSSAVDLEFTVAEGVYEAEIQRQYADGKQKRDQQPEFLKPTKEEKQEGKGDDAKITESKKQSVKDAMEKGGQAPIKEGEDQAAECKCKGQSQCVEGCQCGEECKCKKVTQAYKDVLTQASKDVAELKQGLLNQAKQLQQQVVQSDEDAQTAEQQGKEASKQFESVATINLSEAEEPVVKQYRDCLKTQKKAQKDLQKAHQSKKIMVAQAASTAKAIVECEMITGDIASMQAKQPQQQQVVQKPDEQGNQSQVIPQISGDVVPVQPVVTPVAQPVAPTPLSVDELVNKVQKLQQAKDQLSYAAQSSIVEKLVEMEEQVSGVTQAAKEVCDKVKSIQQADDNEFVQKTTDSCQSVLQAAKETQGKIETMQAQGCSSEDLEKASSEIKKMTDAVEAAQMQADVATKIADAQQNAKKLQVQLQSQQQAMKGAMEALKEAEEAAIEKDKKIQTAADAIKDAEQLAQAKIKDLEDQVKQAQQQAEETKKTPPAEVVKHAVMQALEEQANEAKKKQDAEQQAQQEKSLEEKVKQLEAQVAALTQKK